MQHQTFPPAASARDYSSTTMADSSHRHSTASPQDADAVSSQDGAGDYVAACRM